jgi:hypothetical protein
VRAYFGFFLVLILIGSQAVSAARPNSPFSPTIASPVTPHPILDTAAIHALYMEGEFESATEQLERAIGEGLLKSHADSVFAYKHLGVMYAAKYETTERGKNFMYLLLTIEPSVKILDMYASEMIYMIFRNVQAEYLLRTGRPNDSTAQVAKDSSKGGPSIKANRSRAWPYWAAGALALAGAGTAAYFLSQDDPAPSKKYRGGF